MTTLPDSTEPPADCSPEVFSELQAFSTPRVVVPTKWRWMEAYGTLDEAELGFRKMAAEAHHQGFELWLRQIGLFHKAFNRLYDWRDVSDREVQQAISFRLDLLGLAGSNSKLALDALLGGYYSGCMAIERHMLETWRRVVYARLHPQDVWRWYPKEIWPEDIGESEGSEARRPRMSNGVPTADEIAKIIGDQGNERDRMFLPNVHRGIRSLNAHSHPTIEGASHLWDWQDPDRRFFGPTYSRLHCRRCLKWGLFAGGILLTELRTLSHQGDDWISEFDQLMEATGHYVFEKVRSSDGHAESAADDDL